MIYLASPYTDENETVREQRFQDACRVTAALLKRGDRVFSPIVHGHPLTAYGCPKEFDWWRAHCLESLELCARMLVLTLPGWESSKGIRAEIEHASRRNIPINFVSLFEACGENQNIEQPADGPSTAQFLRTTWPDLFREPMDADRLALIADIDNGGRAGYVQSKLGRGRGTTAIFVGAAISAIYRKKLKAPIVYYTYPHTRRDVEYLINLCSAKLGDSAVLVCKDMTFRVNDAIHVVPRKGEPMGCLLKADGGRRIRPSLILDDMPRALDAPA